VCAQVPQVRDKLVRGRDWPAVAEQQLLNTFSKFEDSTDADLQRIGRLYQDDALEDMLDPQDAAAVEAAMRKHMQEEAL
jgi:hypothetical protein